MTDAQRARKARKRKAYKARRAAAGLLSPQQLERRAFYLEQARVKRANN